MVVKYLSLVLCDSEIERKICTNFNDNQIDWRSTVSFLREGSQLDVQGITNVINQMRKENREVEDANRIHPIIIIGKNNIDACLQFLESLQNGFPEKMINPHLIWLLDRSRICDTWALIKGDKETKNDILSDLKFKISMVSQRSTTGSIYAGQDETLAAQLAVMSACDMLKTDVWTGLFVYGTSQLAIQAKEMDRLVTYMIIDQAIKQLRQPPHNRETQEPVLDEVYWQDYFGLWDSGSGNQSAAKTRLVDMELNTKISRLIPCPEEFCVFLPQSEKDVQQACSFFREQNYNHLISNVVENLISEWKEYFHNKLLQQPGRCTLGLADFLDALSTEQIDEIPPLDNNIVISFPVHRAFFWQHKAKQMNSFYDAAQTELLHLNRTIRTEFLQKLQKALEYEAKWVIQQNKNHQNKLLSLDTTGLTPVIIGGFDNKLVDPIENAVKKTVQIDKVSKEDWTKHIQNWAQSIQESEGDPIDKINSTEASRIENSVMTRERVMAPINAHMNTIDTSQTRTVMFISKRIKQPQAEAIKQKWDVSDVESIPDDNIYILREYRIDLNRFRGLDKLEVFHDDPLQDEELPAKENTAKSESTEDVTIQQNIDKIVTSDNKDYDLCISNTDTGYLITCPDWEKTTQRNNNVTVRVHTSGKTRSGLEQDYETTFEVGASTSSYVSWCNDINKDKPFYGICKVKICWNGIEKTIDLQGYKHVIRYTIHKNPKHVLRIKQKDLECHTITIQSNDRIMKRPQLAIYTKECFFTLGNQKWEKLQVYLPDNQISDIQLKAVDDNNQFEFRSE